MQIILASQSPRRKAYMEQLFGVGGFRVVASDIPEPFDDALTYIENAEALALAKAKHVQQQFPDALIIASDSIVEVDSQLLAKAETEAEAEAMLRLQVGRRQNVVSALAVLSPDKQIVTHDTTEVIFKNADEPGVEETLVAWVKSGKWRGFAAAYAIQQEIGFLAKSIRGDISNVIGFTVKKLREVLLNEFDITTKELG